MYKSMLLILLGVISFAQEGLSFSKDDWQVDCDNTRTCRATGYINENDVNFDDIGASIMLVIELGKDSRIYGFVRTIEDVPQTVNLYVNGQNFGKLEFSPVAGDDRLILLGAQIDRLLNSKTIQSIELKNKNNTFKISANGMTAVFLKIDEFQNRINTPLALVKKGNQSVDQLKPYVDPPVIKMGKIVKDQSVIDAVTKNIEKFYPYLEKQFNVDSDEDSNCWVSSYEDLESIKHSIRVESLNENQALISHQCWRAAYNFADLYWLVDKNLDYVEQVGEYTSFEDGVLWMYSKGSGLGGCLFFAESVWNGHIFQSASFGETGSCNAPPDGYWKIPRYIAKVIPYAE